MFPQQQSHLPMISIDDEQIFVQKLANKSEYASLNIQCTDRFAGCYGNRDHRPGSSVHRESAQMADDVTNCYTRLC
jgi:hypothetical protein